MKYIIDDYDLLIYFEELSLAGLLSGDHRFYPKDFLKDKKPVEEIAPANVINEDFPQAYTIDGIGLDSLCYFLKKHFLNKTVIIHIEVEEGN